MSKCKITVVKRTINQELIDEYVSDTRENFGRCEALEDGQEFIIERLDRGEYRLVRQTPPLNDGVVDWLLACPEKGYFVPIESEATDTL